MSRTHYPVLAVVFDKEGRVLMGRRDEARNKFNKLWQFPGGGIEFGEDPKDAVIREVWEETGVKIELLSKHPFAFNYIDAESNSHIIILGFVARYVSGEIDVSRDPNTGEARWFTYDEIDFAKTSPLSKELVDSAVEFLEDQKNK